MRFDGFHYYLGIGDVTADDLFDAADREVIAASILAAEAELIVIESGVTSVFGDVLDGATLRAAEEQGKTVLGYVNVAVPDAGRTLLQGLPGWIEPSTDDEDDLDYGTIKTENDAGDPPPEWLTNFRGIAEGPEYYLNGKTGDGIFGYIVDYGDPAWREIVVAQAVDIVSAYDGPGYAGVFLDDVGRYFPPEPYEDYEYDDMGPEAVAYRAELARNAIDMMELVNEVADAVHAVREDAVIVLNGGGFLKFDAQSGVDSPPAGNHPEWWEMLGHVDAILAEATSEAKDVPDWSAIKDNWEGTIDLLYLVDEGRADEASVAAARELGVTVAIDRSSSAYNLMPPAGEFAPQPDPVRTVSGGMDDRSTLGTPGADEIDLRAQTFGETIIGGGGDDTIYGTAGDDLIYGGTGADIIYGGGGDDTILGGLGDDTLFGGLGNDVLVGEGGSDDLDGGGGEDVLGGNTVPDEFLF